MIPKSVKQARITENLKSTELKLDQEDMRRLRGVDKNIRLMLVRNVSLNMLVVCPEDYGFTASHF